jgi:hypothetical protein
VLALNLTLELPAGIRTVEGTVTAAVLLLETANWRPPAGATAPVARLTLTVALWPPATLDGVAVTLP